MVTNTVHGEMSKQVEHHIGTCLGKIRVLFILTLWNDLLIVGNKPLFCTIAGLLLILQG